MSEDKMSTEQKIEEEFNDEEDTEVFEGIEVTDSEEGSVEYGVADERETVEVYLEDLEALAETIAEYEDQELLEDVSDHLFRERIIYINEDITPETVENVVPLLHYFNTKDNELKVEDRKKISIHINSDGGCLHSSLLIAQEMRDSKTPIQTICNGKAFSGGLLLFMCVQDRVMGDFASLMFHEARTGGYGVQGTMKEIDRSTDYYKKLQKFYDDIVVEGSNITHKQLNKHKNKINDWFIGKEEAIKLGIVRE